MARRKAKPAKPPPSLAPRERKFVEEYLLTGRKVHSYRHAFPGAGYKTASVQVGRLLAKPSIGEEIRAAQADQRRRFNVTAAKVIRKWCELAFSDIGDVIDLTVPRNPKLKPRADIPAEARRAIQSVAKTRDGVRVKMADQVAALRALSAHLGLAQEIAPLDVLLAALPPELAAQVRAALAGSPSGEK
jgi:phage terminase small subunit